MRLTAYVFVIWGLAFTAGLVGRVLTFDPAMEQAGRWLFGSMCAGIGVALLRLTHFEFDTRNNTLTVLRWYFQVARFPISSIVAVQVTHSPYQRSGQGRISRRAADGISLLLSRETGSESVRLTFHSNNRTTRKMATQLSEVLHVPIEGPLPEVESAAELGIGYRARQIIAKICYWGACASAIWFLALTVEQKNHDTNDDTLREIEAHLVERSVVELNSGADNWYLRGIFEFTLEGEQVTAEGNLIPDQFYRENLGRPYRARDKVPREIVETMVEPWEVGKSYHAFIHIDYPEHIFFRRPPSGKVTRTRRWQLALLAGAMFILGVFVSPGRGKPSTEDS
jgi:hypothetical protein